MTRRVRVVRRSGGGSGKGFVCTSLMGALTALKSVKAMKAGLTSVKPKLSNSPGALRMKVKSRNWVMTLNWMMPRFFRVWFSFQ